ncbi:MAG: hypothetical protein FWD08_01915 [Alphaproteobacteria bacterium]|nr:hypothetical protein [Alphaproteobacteria bacterium]
MRDSMASPLALQAKEADRSVVGIIPECRVQGRRGFVIRKFRISADRKARKKGEGSFPITVDQQKTSRPKSRTGCEKVDTGFSHKSRFSILENRTRFLIWVNCPKSSWSRRSNHAFKADGR